MQNTVKRLIILQEEQRFPSIGDPIHQHNVRNQVGRQSRRSICHRARRHGGLEPPTLSKYPANTSQATETAPVHSTPSTKSTNIPAITSGGPGHHSLGSWQPATPSTSRVQLGLYRPAPLNMDQPITGSPFGEEDHPQNAQSYQTGSSQL